MNNRRQTVINMIANIVSYSATIIVSFILTPFLIENVGKEAYSFYPMANSIVSYMSIVANALNSMASRFVTVELVHEKQEEAEGYYASAFYSSLILGCILLVPMTVVVLSLEYILNVPVNAVAAIKLLFALVFSSALVNICFSVFGIATFAKNRIDLRSVRELIIAVVRLLLFYLFYSILPPSIVYVGIVALIVALINVLIQKRFTIKLLPELRLDRHKMTRRHVKKLLGSSIWNMINSIGDLLMAGTTLIMVNTMYGAEAAGTVSIVQTVPSFLNGIIVMISGVFFPLITRYYAEGKKEELTHEINTAQRCIGAVTGAVVIVFSGLAKEFFSLWVPNENAEYLSIVSFVTILPQIIISCTYPLHNLNVAMNEVRTPAIAMLIGGVLNVLLSLVYGHSNNGGVIAIIAISTAIRYIYYGAFLSWHTSKLLHIKLISIVKPVAISLLCAGITFMYVGFVKKFFSFDSWSQFIISGVLTGIGALAIFATGMFASWIKGSCQR